ncbi:MAG TPA: MGMT family protein [Bacteroidia bacterium]|jgi:methylated-DNA-protein-cysteine methyltransferase-like protein|nr:MGMT family protein [Bacteroidia bacterium]
MNDFYDMIYEVVRQVPKGRVTSYGAIAKYLGSAKSSRLVGWAMNNSHAQKKPVPAHRVVNRNGMLSGKHHFGHPNLMEQLLAKEGIKVKKDVIVNFKKVFWDPATELKL